MFAFFETPTVLCDADIHLKCYVAAVSWSGI